MAPKENSGGQMKEPRDESGMSSTDHGGGKRRFDIITTLHVGVSGPSCANKKSPRVALHRGSGF
jgi:hypothetical protein